MKANDLTGQKFGSLTVIERAVNSGTSKWVCMCDCGKTKTVFGANLLSGRSTSCGCSREKHNESKTTLYNAYSQRKRQGMCEEWKNDYILFKNWAIENGYADGKRIKRIDASKPVSPDNCRIS